MKLFDRYPQPTPTKPTLLQRLRQAQYAIEDWRFDPTKWSSLAVPLVGCLFLLAVFGLTGQLDAADELQMQRVVAEERERMSAFEAGRLAGRDEVLGAIAAGQARIESLPQGGCSNLTTAQVKP